MKIIARAICPLVLLIFTVGCSSTGSYHSFQTYDTPILGKLAKQSIEYEGVARNPVIVIPGIFGSRLEDAASGRIVWGDFYGKTALTKMTDDELLSVSLPMRLHVPLSALTDAVDEAHALDMVRIKILGFSLHLNAYRDMIDALEMGGYHSVQHTAKGRNGKEYQYDTLFTFGYDWRRDIVENVAKLHAFIEEKRGYLQQRYEEIYGVKDYDVQFDIVAHSMGGLIARYYLRYGAHDLPSDGSLPPLTWEGSTRVDKLIVVGTPNAGYLDSFIELVNGLTLVPGVHYEAAVLGTFPSLYQMLPVGDMCSVVESRYKDGPSFDIFDADLWIRLQWGIVSPKQDVYLEKILPTVTDPTMRRKIVTDHLRKCLQRARQFSQALRVPAKPPADVAIHLFLSDAVHTSNDAMVRAKTGNVKVVAYEPGDGKVTAASALCDERVSGEWKPFVQSPIQWSSVTFVFAAHMGITSDPVFVTNMLYILLGSKTAEQWKKR